MATSTSTFESELRELHAIVNRQISEPGSDSAYVREINEVLGRISGGSPHDITLEESQLFTTLYRAITEQSARNFKASSATHLTVAISIMNTLRLDDALMDQTFGPDLALSPLSVQSIPRQAVSQFLGEINQCLVNNKHGESFGSLFNVGLSTKTKVICCVFGSRTPETFIAPTELVCEGISLPVLIFRNWIVESATLDDVPCTWRNRAVCQPAKIDLSGQSVGQQGDITAAGSFGFYGLARGVLYGFMAAHCVPKAQPGSIIVSPSARELTGRLQTIVRYTKFDPNPIKILGRLESELQTLLKTGLRSEDSTNGCEIIETLETGENWEGKIVLSGQEFGRVVGTSATYKAGILERHNNRLHQQEATIFDLPPYDNAGLGVGREGHSRIDWCCFEVLKERFGRNRIKSDLNENDVVTGIDLLKPDMKVFKVGRTTGLTSGTVNGCIMQRWSENGDEKKNLTMEIVVLGDRGLFADCGDSGSLVTTDEVTPYGVGVVIGKDRSNTLTVVTPLWAIFEDVEDTLHLRMHWLEILE